MLNTEITGQDGLVRCMSLLIRFRLAALAIGILLWGWKQRHQESDFALVIQAVGLLYLRIFAGLSLYQIIPSFLA
ncbi:MAG: hypothetical protein ACI87H_003623 [Gammaproteobacteria bacterium]|jgi:hypothetical protein